MTLPSGGFVEQLGNVLGMLCVLGVCAIPFSFSNGGRPIPNGIKVFWTWWLGMVLVVFGFGAVAWLFGAKP